jgi:Domain of unknown function (DUF4338)
MEAIFSYRHRRLTEPDIAFIRELIAAHPAASRRQLSTKLCQAWSWAQANGALREMVCRGLMLELHRAGLIELPPIVKQPPNPLARRIRPVRVGVDTQPLHARLNEIGALRLCQVRRTPEEARFNSLLEQYHYLGYTQPVGEQLKYLVYANERPIACVAWSSAPRHLGCRDRFIGWSAQARLKNIHLLAYNPRFLILPWVRVPHLASHLLGRMARSVPQDWESQYGHPVYYLETFIDPQRFCGTCYQAANWIRLGHTTGRGKDDSTGKPNRPLKEILGYPLVKDFRHRLGAL